VKLFLFIFVLDDERRGTMNEQHMQNLGGESPTVDLQPAGFWKRFAAYIIDGLVIGIPLAIISTFIIGAILYANIDAEVLSDPNMVEAELTDEELFAVLKAYGLVLLVNFIAAILYYAGLHASKWQATIGKKLLGLKVVSMQGERISFWRSLGRFLAQSFLSPIFMIGYIIAAFTEKKQALHDLIAGTMVVKK
jgi:uncharacterized RDD family membrane protein YckC